MPVDVHLLLGFLVLSTLLSAVPGPSVVLESSRAITCGRRSAMWVVAGNAVGGLFLLTLVVAGLGAVVTASEIVFQAIKVAGACYLLWLGVQLLRSARRREGALALEDAARGSTPARSLRQGFVVGAGNPKSVVSLMAILPQFVDPAGSSPALQMLVIGLCGALAQVLIETGWVLAAGALRAWFLRRPRRLSHLETAGGVAMVGLAGRLAMQRP